MGEHQASSNVRFEFGNHVILNVFQNDPKVINDTFGISVTVQTKGPTWVERYKLRNFGFEVSTWFPGCNSAGELLLVFLAAGMVERHSLEWQYIARGAECVCDSCGIDNRRGAMLVPIPKPVQFVEQYYMVPFLVRSHGRYPVMDRTGESAYLREITVSEGGSGPVEFETDAVVRLEDLSMPQTKLSGVALRLWITSPVGNLIDGGGC